jgi:hypothetical protein
MVDSNSVFLNNSKEYIKIELEIFSELQNGISEIGLLLYFEIAIHEPISPVISDSARNIARKFPSWTQIYEDSFERSTPELATPVSNAGAFINSLVGEYLDEFTDLVDEYKLDSFISSADEDMIDWVYVSYGIPASTLSIFGDDVQLAKAPTLEAFYNYRKTDYVYYHNLIDGQIITLRKFEDLIINNVVYDQTPVMMFNAFDDFGARVNLKRLYLEDNARFKKRILDVYANPPGVGTESYKLTLRRELDIWKAYGATPQSDYLGATPEILEISDIENSTPYFTFSGNPQEKFIDFVRYINETYPSNLGYVHWDQGIWDYAGLDGEGVGRLPAIYDVATPLSTLFQPGVGDLRDAKLILPNDIPESATTSFTGRFKADGFKIDGYSDIYGPINVGYTYSGLYTQTVPDPDVSNPNSATPFNGGVALVYEVQMPPHTGYATPATYYANLSYEDRDDFFVYNYYSQTSAASPEYNYIPIVSSDNLTDTNILFREKTYDYVYVNFAATPSNNSIDISKASSITLVNKVSWNASNQVYTPAHTGQYRVAFNQDARGYLGNPSVSETWSLATPNINYVNANIKIGSTVYGNKSISGSTNSVQSEAILNDNNDLSKLKDYPIFSSDLKKGIIFPIGSVPSSIVIENVKVTPQPLYQTIQAEIVRDPEHGGIAYNPIDNSNYYVPSSPNIVIKSFAVADDAETNAYTYSGFFESATFNYSSAPELITLSTGLSSTPYYPFKKSVWSPILDSELLSTPMLNGYIDHLGNVYRQGELIEDSGRSINSNIKDQFLSSYNLNRETFGLDSSEKDDYLITHIKPISDTSGISITSNKTEVFPNSEVPVEIVLPFTQSSSYIEELYNESSDNYYFSEIEVYAEKIGNKKESLYYSLNNKNPELHTGWLYLPEEDYYIYADPKTDSFSGILFNAELSDIPRQGAPILVQVIESGATAQYTEMMYPDSATPGKPVFSNTETLVAANDSALYLSNSNVNNIVINDVYTGKSLVEYPLQPGFYIWALTDDDGNYIWDLFLDEGYYTISESYTLDGNKLEVFSDTTGLSILVPGRSYEVTYDLTNVFYVDKNDYDSNNDEYNAKIYFSSTPNTSANYYVTYESAIDEFSTPTGISLSSVGLPITKGFVFISDAEYEFGSAEVTVSPSYISDNSDDFVYLNIVSYDENKNLKPNQTFYIYSTLLTPDSAFVTTNDYGFVSTKLRYTGPVPATAIEATINIQGLEYSSSTPQINVNSAASPYYESINVSVNISSNSSAAKLKAVATRGVIKADVISDNYIRGYINHSTIPGATPVVYWRKGRTVYSAFEEVNYSTSSATPGRTTDAGIVYLNPNGEFQIGPFYAQERTEAGYWFVAVESEMSITPTVSPNTTIGDVAYWYESYDNLSYDTELIPLPNIYGSLIQENSKIIETPAFRFNHYDMDHSETAPATVNWNPPKWLPLSYYDQYQMGLLGSTPNIVSTYSNIVNDYEES